MPISRMCFQCPSTKVQCAGRSPYRKKIQTTALPHSKKVFGFNLWWSLFALPVLHHGIPLGATISSNDSKGIKVR